MILDRRGFTLGEVLASMIALGIIALTVQSLILFANNFLNQQGTALSSLEEQTLFSRLICNKFQKPVFAAYDPTRSFKYKPDDQSYVKRSSSNRPDPSEDPAVFSVPLLAKSSYDATDTTIQNLSVTGHSAVNTFLKAALTVSKSVNDSTKVLRAHIGDEAATFNKVDGANGDHDYHSQFYDIYADDHTLPTFMVRQSKSDGVLGQISDGFIYASRCIKNEVDPADPGSAPGTFIEIGGNSPDYSIIDRTDNSDMPEDEILATALYVLEQKWRPFYFPKQELTKNKVVCCDISDADAANIQFLPTDTLPPTNCKTLEQYTPIIYVINVSSDGDGVEKEILGNNSLEGYAQSNVGGFAGLGICKHSSDTTKVDWSKDDCKEAVKAKYFTELGKKIVHPVKFTNMEELPLIKKDRVATWAYGFIAPSFGNDSHYREFKIMSIENKCHSSLPVGLCGKAIPGKDLSDQDNYVQGKSVAEYFIAKVRHCPFRYLTMGNSASPLPLGLDRTQ